MRIAKCNCKSKFFHVMVQGIKKENIFKEAKLKEKFIEMLKKYSFENEVVVLAYCVMNNHSHMLIYTEETSNLSKMMHALNMNFANKYNKSMNRCGYVFRNRYRSEEITDISYLKNCIRYIHNNPVKAKICEKCDEYAFSSYHEYVHKLINTKVLNDILGEDISFLFENTAFEPNNYNFLDINNEFEENPNLTLEEIISEYKLKNDILGEFLSKEQLKPLVNLLVNTYKISQKEVKEVLKITRYMLENLLKN